MAKKNICDCSCPTGSCHHGNGCGEEEEKVLTESGLRHIIEKLTGKLLLAVGTIKAKGEGPLHLWRKYTKLGVIIHGKVDEATPESSGLLSAEDKAFLDKLREWFGDIDSFTPITVERIQELWGDWTCGCGGCGGSDGGDDEPEPETGGNASLSVTLTYPNIAGGGGSVAPEYHVYQEVEMSDGTTEKTEVTELDDVEFVFVETWGATLETESGVVTKEGYNSTGEKALVCTIQINVEYNGLTATAQCNVYQEAVDIGDDDPNWDYPDPETTTESSGSELYVTKLGTITGNTAGSYAYIYTVDEDADGSYTGDVPIRYTHNGVTRTNNKPTVEVESDFEGITAEMGERFDTSTSSWRDWHMTLHVPAEVMAKIPEDSSMLLCKLRIKDELNDSYDEGHPRESVVYIIGIDSVGTFDSGDIRNACFGGAFWNSWISSLSYVYKTNSTYTYTNTGKGSLISNLSVGNISVGDRFVLDIREPMEFEMDSHYSYKRTSRIHFGIWFGISRAQKFYDDRVGAVVSGTREVYRKELVGWDMEVEPPVDVEDSDRGYLRIDAQKVVATVDELPEVGSAGPYSGEFLLCYNDVETQFAMMFGLLKGSPVFAYKQEDDDEEGEDEPDTDDGNN